MVVIVEIINSSPHFHMGQVSGRIEMGEGWGIYISLAAIFEGIHISLVICERGYTYHGDTHITVTPVRLFPRPSLLVLVTYRGRTGSGNHVQSVNQAFLHIKVVVNKTV